MCTSVMYRGVSVSGIHFVISIGGFFTSTAEMFQAMGRAAREGGERGVCVLLLHAQSVGVRLGLLTPGEEHLLDSSVAYLGHVLAASCLRQTVLASLGGGGVVCAECDECCRCGACDGWGMGTLPFLSSWADGVGGGAAESVLRLVAAQPNGEMSLGRLLKSPPDNAVAPFQHRNNHGMLVFALVARRYLLLELRTLRGGDPHQKIAKGISWCVARVSPGSLSLLGGASTELPVLVSDDAFAAIPATSPDGGRATTSTGRSTPPRAHPR